MARRNKADQPRPARKDRRGMDPVLAGILLLLGLGIFIWFGFTKDIPFRSGFQLKAVVTDAVSIRANSPVRIAGVNVGTVKSVEPYGDGEGPKRASIVTMELKDEALPIHKDATIKIRPRIFLEGNWFVELRPGTPASPELSSGDKLPITQAAAPVQFEQLLTTLQSDTRKDLQALLVGYGTALTHEPVGAENADQDPMVRGKTAAEALNMSLDTAGPALRGTAAVNEALLGQNTGDLSKLIASTARVTRALGEDTDALKGLVTNLNRTTGALADERENLGRSIALLGPTVEHGKEAFTAIDAALPDVRALALELVPGVKESPATIDASLPWIKQATALVGKDELGGVAAELAPTTKSLAAQFDENLRLLPQADLVAQCATNYLLPLGDIKVEDGDLSTGVENYKEFAYALVGLNGESQNFDGNGHYLRFQVGGGKYAWATGPYTDGNPKTKGVRRQWARTNNVPLGTRPAYTRKLPPQVRTKACKDQKLPNVNGHPAGPADGTDPAGTPTLIYEPPAPLKATVKPKPESAEVSTDITAALAERLNPFAAGGDDR